MDLLRAIRPARRAHAHCDIPCGVYDPAQARIEAESCYRIIEKYHASRTRSSGPAASIVKEERAELTKHHIDVMWHDYFKPEHVEKYPDLHDVCWKASKQASQVKRTLDLDEAQKLLDAHRPHRRDVEGHRRSRAPGCPPEPATRTAASRGVAVPARSRCASRVRHAESRRPGAARSALLARSWTRSWAAAWSPRSRPATGCWSTRAPTGRARRASASSCWCPTRASRSACSSSASPRSTRDGRLDVLGGDAPDASTDSRAFGPVGVDERRGPAVVPLLAAPTDRPAALTGSSGRSSAMSRTCSRSRGRKSWKSSRSMPVAAYSAMTRRGPRRACPGPSGRGASSSQASASSAALPKMASWAAVRRRRSASSRPTSTPVMTERVSVARVAPDGLAGGVEARHDLAHLRRASRS